MMFEVVGMKIMYILLFVLMVILVITMFMASKMVIDSLFSKKEPNDRTSCHEKSELQKRRFI